MKPDETTLLTALEKYGYALKDNNNFTTYEKYQILAHIGSIADPFYLNCAGIKSGNTVWNSESVLYNSIIEHKNIISVFQNNKYYQLPDLKEGINRIQRIIGDDTQ